MSDLVTEFRLEIPEKELDDLRSRLRQTRWADPETVDDWSQGVPLAYLQDLCGYWADDYDWRPTESRLNAMPQFRTVIDGLGVHFLHVRSPHADAMPLIISHGWPGSIIEFLRIIGPLTDPTAVRASAWSAAMAAWALNSPKRSRVRAVWSTSKPCELPNHRPIVRIALR